MALEVWGNEKTMNLDQILFTNIQASPYFKGLLRLHTFEEVVDEIYDQVSYLEPYVPGCGKVPSSAFCLLYKAYTLKLTKHQIGTMIRHKDSPFLWDWLGQFIDDEEELNVRQKGKPTTIGKFVKDILKEQRYCEILFPRIPVLVQKDINQALQEYEAETAPQTTTTATATTREPERTGREIDRYRGRGRSPRSRSGERDRAPKPRSRSRERDRRDRRSRSPPRRDRRSRSRSRDRRDRRSRSRSRDRRRGRSPVRRSRSRSGSRDRKRTSYSRSRSRSPKHSKRLSPEPSKPAKYVSYSLHVMGRGTGVLTKSCSNTKIIEQLDKLRSIYGDASAGSKPALDSSYKSMGKHNSLQEETIVLGLRK